MKKLYSILLALTLCFIPTATILAKESPQENLRPNVKIINLSDNITEKTIQEIKSSVSASLKYNDGTMVPIDSVIIIEDAPSVPLARNVMLQNDSDINQIGNSYIVSVTASTSKLVSDSGDINTSKTSASATLRLQWLDVSGPKNEIQKVSGTLTLNRGTVTSGTVRYGNGAVSAINWTSHNVGSNSSFSYSPNQMAFDPTADYSISFKDELFGLYLKVSASIFQ